MIAALLVVLLAAGPGCSRSEPPPLPPSRLVRPEVDGRMVRHGPVRGYLARPIDRDERGGTLLLVDAVDDAARAAARAEAAEHRLALAVGPDAPLDEARAWIARLAGGAEVRERCLRAACPGDAP